MALHSFRYFLKQYLNAYTVIERGVTFSEIFIGALSLAFLKIV